MLQALTERILFLLNSSFQSSDYAIKGILLRLSNVYFKKSALIGAKQSIKTPGSKHTQPCRTSGSI